MKKLFCTVVTSFDDSLESPVIYFTRAKGIDEVEPRIKEELEELGWEGMEIEDIFDVFTFEVHESDIVEV